MLQWELMTMLKADEQYLTVNEAAKRLGVTPGRIRQFICRGQLPSIKFGWVRAIAKSDIDQFIRKRNERARRSHALRTS